MWLFIKNIKTKRFFKKLNHKWIDSFKIKKVLKDACQLNLSQLMRIHNIFHTSLLRTFATDSLIEQIYSSSFSIVVSEEEKYEVNDILDNKYHYEKLQYKVVWIDHFSNRAWYLTENFQNHSKKFINNYHQRYSNKSKFALKIVHIANVII